MIDSSQVYKCLEKKTLIMGFELTDLLVLGLLLSVLNILFTHTSAKLFLTWGPVVSLSIFIRLMKSGKAENYIIHAIRYKLSPGIYNAFKPSTKNELLNLKRKGHLNVRSILEYET